MVSRCTVRLAVTWTRTALLGRSSSPNDALTNDKRDTNECAPYERPDECAFVTHSFDKRTRYESGIRKRGTKFRRAGAAARQHGHPAGPPCGRRRHPWRYQAPTGDAATAAAAAATADPPVRVPPVPSATPTATRGATTVFSRSQGSIGNGCGGACRPQSRSGAAGGAVCFPHHSRQKIRHAERESIPFTLPSLNKCLNRSGSRSRRVRRART